MCVKRALRFLAQQLPLSDRKKGLRNSLGRFLEGACLRPELQHMRWMTFLTPEQRKELYCPDIYLQVCKESEDTILRYLDNPGLDRLQRQLYCDTSLYLAENILCKVDLMSMASSLEARVPLLDNEVLDFVLRMPSRFKLRGKNRKYILKKAYARDLPSEVLSRKKQGFSIPLKSWLNADWNSLMHSVLNERDIKTDGLFNSNTIRRWMREHEIGKANRSHILWSLMVFQMWKARFLPAQKARTTAALPYFVGNFA
jgi:asparagine synthase (glutamine-hydrolysing)